MSLPYGIFPAIYFLLSIVSIVASLLMVVVFGARERAGFAFVIFAVAGIAGLIMNQLGYRGRIGTTFLTNAFLLASLISLILSLVVGLFTNARERANYAIFMFAAAGVVGIIMDLSGLGAGYLASLSNIFVAISLLSFILALIMGLFTSANERAGFAFIIFMAAWVAGLILSFFHL